MPWHGMYRCASRSLDFRRHRCCLDYGTQASMEASSSGATMSSESLLTAARQVRATSAAAAAAVRTTKRRTPPTPGKRGRKARRLAVKATSDGNVFGMDGRSTPIGGSEIGEIMWRGCYASSYLLRRSLPPKHHRLDDSNNVQSASHPKASHSAPPFQAMPKAIVVKQIPHSHLPSVAAIIPFVLPIPSVIIIIITTDPSR